MDVFLKAGVINDTGRAFQDEEAMISTATGKPRRSAPAPALPSGTELAQGVSAGTTAGALTPVEAAAFLKIDEKTLRRYTNAGDIPHRRIGKQIRYSPAVLTHWLAGDNTRKLQPCGTATETER